MMQQIKKDGNTIFGGHNEGRGAGRFIMKGAGGFITKGRGAGFFVSLCTFCIPCGDQG